MKSIRLLIINFIWLIKLMRFISFGSPFNTDLLNSSGKMSLSYLSCIISVILFVNHPSLYATQIICDNLISSGCFVPLDLDHSRPNIKWSPISGFLMLLYILGISSLILWKNSSSQPFFVYSFFFFIVPSLDFMHFYRKSLLSTRFFELFAHMCYFCVLHFFFVVNTCFIK